jgi:hypothetical protein
VVYKPSVHACQKLSLIKTVGKRKFKETNGSLREDERNYLTIKR